MHACKIWHEHECSTNQWLTYEHDAFSLRDLYTSSDECIENCLLFYLFIDLLSGEREGGRVDVFDRNEIVDWK